MTLPIYPIVRFTEWDKLTHDMRERARAAGYHEKFWNKLGTLPAEEMDYASLKPEVRKFLEGVPISAKSWDCYVNHYRNYDWGELGEAQARYTALGWTAGMWDSGETPKEEGKYWNDLTAVQQQAATGLCYTQEIWDDIAIPLWKKDDGEGGEEGEEDAPDLYSNEETKVAEEKQDIYKQMYGNDDENMAFNGPASAHSDRGIAVPFFRFDPWDLLGPDQKSIAGAALYDEKSWNAIGTNKLESMDWDSIGEKHHTMQKALRHLGFSAEQWDCYMLHYSTYDWRELEDAGVKQFFKDLGYSHATWERREEPDTFGMYWPDLTEAQQNAAYQVGYFREVWDDVSLQFWPRTLSNTVSLKDHVNKHKAAVGVGTSAIFVGLIIVCAYCYWAKSKRKESARVQKEVEMFDGKRFSDYSDEQVITDAIRISSPGSGSEDDGYDDDCQHQVKPIV